MNCELGHDHELAGRYIAGELSTDEAIAFELHYFECDACLESVELGQAIQHGAQHQEAPRDIAAPKKVITMPARVQPLAQPPRYWKYAAIAAAAIIAVTLVGWRALKGPEAQKVDTARGGAAPVPPTSNPIPSPSTAPPDLVASNASPDLGAIEPLPYRQAVLRGTNDDAAERFRRTMVSYQARDFRKASVGLSSIPVGVPGSGKPDEHVTDAGIQLYLGISRLMLNDNADAVRALSRSVAYGDTPYLESAGYYLAKGLIRQKQYTDAANQLRRTVALNGDRQRDAQQLLEQVNQLQAR